VKFTLAIELGNDAMQGVGDVASALRKLAGTLDRIAEHDETADADEMSDCPSGRVIDRNGNKVGEWEVLP
jgi:hypothetical protein